MKPMVAVLGAGGFIGNRIVEMFHLGGEHEVRAITRRPEALALALRFELDGRVADARDEAALTEAFSGCSHVVHAVAGPPDTITGSVAPVYRAAARAGVRRIVYLSSASVHGQSPAPGTDETSALSHRQPLAYNNAKVMAERKLEELRRDGGVEVVRLRPGIVHGPRSYWIGGFADEVLSREAYMVEGGAGICNAIYIDNLVHAIRLALSVPRADGEAYIVGDAETVTWADLCRPIVDALGYSWDDLSRPAPDAGGLSPRAAAKTALRRTAALLPRRSAKALRAAYRAWRSPVAAAAKGPGGPPVSRERAELHLCSVRLPMTKACRDLGYRPIIDFETASRLNLAWLAHAGYPVHVDPGCHRKDANG